MRLEYFRRMERRTALADTPPRHPAQTRFTATVAAMRAQPSSQSAIPKSDDTWLVSAACRVYLRRHGMSEAQLAGRLQTSLEKLQWLQMRTRPNPAAPTFTAEVERLALAFGCEAGLLGELLTAC